MATAPAITDPNESPINPGYDEQLSESQDGSTEEESYGDWNENIPEELQGTIKKLCEHVCDEFRYPRRIEVMKSWQARSFWRELQHLNWNWTDESWDIMGPAGAGEGGPSNPSADSSVLYSTNMYQGFGESFIAIITQAIPSVRFEPEDPDEAADIETAQAAEPIKKLIQHENDPVALLTKAAFYAWTDGRMHGWTRWEVDKRTMLPREFQSIFGVMEVKVPVIYEDQESYPYLQYSDEFHLSTVRAKIKSRSFNDKDYWKKIKGGSSSNGQDIYERTARISVKQGISWKSAGGDAYSHLVTTQRTFVRPTHFLSPCVPDEDVAKLEALFPNGMYAEFDNGTYTGSKDCNMDDEWTVINVMEGDGSNRPAKGTCLISVQERANDIINLTQDVYEKTVPASHWDDKLWDIDAMKRYKAMPSSRKGVNMSELQPGDALGNHVFFEPPSVVSPDMLNYLKELMTDIPEFLTGISAILFGSDSQGDKSGKALSIQQAAAMGRIGLPFRAMKRFYARMMEQGVRCALTNRKEDTQLGVPTESGDIETVAVRIAGMTGKIRCFPVSDENYPESPMQKRNTYMQLLAEAAADPVLKAILSSPQNQNLAKKLIGLDELVIPESDSWNKQLVEINYMLQEIPTPPQPQAPVDEMNPLTGDPEVIQPPPVPPRSSIPIDPEYDDHAAEYLTVKIWVNSPKGQKAKKVNPSGFMNVRLHGLDHKAALQAAMMPPGGAQPVGAGAPPPAPPAAQAA